MSQIQPTPAHSQLRDPGTNGWVDTGRDAWAQADSDLAVSMIQAVG